MPLEIKYRNNSREMCYLINCLIRNFDIFLSVVDFICKLDWARGTQMVKHYFGCLCESVSGLD